MAVLIVVTVVTGLWIPEAQTQTAVSPDVIGRAFLRTVLILSLDKNRNQVEYCSGSFVSPSGLILTAAHCVRAVQDKPAIGVRKGELYNPDGLAAVAVNLPDHIKPVLQLMAQRIADDPAMDFALLKTIGYLGKEGARPASFPFMPIGDSERVRAGDPIAVIGFPGTGGETVSAPEGHVIGFTADDQDKKLHIKHDASAGQGASGGPIITADGCEVAVAVRESGEQGPGGTYFGIMTNRIPSGWARYFPKADEAAAAQSLPPGCRGRSVPQPAPSAGIVIQATIVDALSGAGIGGALFVLSPPGRSATARARQNIAQGQSDGKGFFQTSPGVARGQTYPVQVIARGYQVIRTTFLVKSNAPDVIRLNPIQMQRQ